MFYERCRAGAHPRCLLNADGRNVLLIARSISASHVRSPWRFLTLHVCKDRLSATSLDRWQGGHRPPPRVISCSALSHLCSLINWCVNTHSVILMPSPAISRRHPVFGLSVCDPILWSLWMRYFTNRLSKWKSNFQLRCTWGQRWTD